MSVSQEPNPALVFDLVNSFHKTEALKAAVELDLFAALGEGNSTVEEIAQRCKSTKRGIRILCDYLSILGVVVKQGNRYFHSATSGAFLDSRSPACIASIVKVLNNPMMMDSYDHLSKVIRQGYTNLPGQGTVEPEHPIWVEFAHNMAPMMAPMTGPLGNAVLNGNRGPMRVLDVAAGHGLFGIEVAKQNPEAEIVAVDWKPVLEVARANAEKAGIGARFHLKPGSVFEVDLEGPYDIILLTNFLHHFDPDTCVTLLEKCRSVMTPGGMVAALEFVPNEDRVTPPIAASFALIMLATTQAGDAYTLLDYEKMFSSAGFVEIGMQDVPPSPHRIVKARTPLA
jgi:2-polyprenyl-3-methyl-5-hydroxy-6-metoxy-1,4-benzoquinol methylase